METGNMTDHRNDGAAIPPRIRDGLKREAPLNPDAEGRLVSVLRQEGLLRPTVPRWVPMVMQLAAAVAFLLVGAWGGATWARRSSLEAMLDQKDMAIGDRVLLMQRAGSAYIRAAQNYADAARGVDSSAVEVASRVLLGAAQAVAKNSLDAGLTPHLTSLLQNANYPQITRF
jgi:hypothetical protein